VEFPGVDMTLNTKKAVHPHTTPHILLKGITIPFNYLSHYDLKLHFEKAGTIEVTVSVGM